MAEEGGGTADPDPATEGEGSALRRHFSHHMLYAIGIS